MRFQKGVSETPFIKTADKHYVLLNRFRYWEKFFSCETGCSFHRFHNYSKEKGLVVSAHLEKKRSFHQLFGDIC